MLTSTNKFAWSYDDIIFPVGFASQRVLDKDPLVWLDGARPPKACLQCIKSIHLMKSNSLVVGYDLRTPAI